MVFLLYTAAPNFPIQSAVKGKGSYIIFFEGVEKPSSTTYLKNYFPVQTSSKYLGSQVVFHPMKGSDVEE
jgi:hypothetical protein